MHRCNDDGDGANERTVVASEKSVAIGVPVNLIFEIEGCFD